MAKAKATLTFHKRFLELIKRAGEGPLGRAIDSAFHTMGLDWQRRNVPGHFEESAPHRYPHYMTRSEKYQKRKQKEFGHRRPMVLTGQMRATLLGRAPTIEGKATTRAVRTLVRLPFVRVANLWTGGGRKHDFHKAITAITRGERRSLVQRMQRRTIFLLRRELSDTGKVTKRFTA